MKYGAWSLTLLVAWLGCGVQPQGAAARAAGRLDDSKGTVVNLDGLQSRTPAEWVEQQEPKRFRLKEFRLPAVKDDKDPAELVIFYFGQGAGGSVADNLKRWKAMMVPPAGKNIDDVAKTEKMKIGAVDATYFEVQGTYLLKERPFDPNSPTTRKPNYHMIKVVFESENGPYFISLVGPEGTVQHYKKGFDEWLKAFK